MVNMKKPCTGKYLEFKGNSDILVILVDGNVLMVWAGISWENNSV